jgi:hypothetical protein
MEEKTEYYTTPTTHYTTTTTTHYTTTTTATSGISDSSKTEHEVIVDEKIEEHISSSAEERGEQHTQVVEEYDAHGNQINFVMSETERRLVRKLDFIYVMPFVCVLNFLQVKYNRKWLVARQLIIW